MNTHGCRSTPSAAGLAAADGGRNVDRDAADLSGL